MPTRRSLQFCRAPPVIIQRIAADQFYEVQESVTKVLNTISKKNRKGLPLLLFDMFLHMLKNLAFLNKTPYVTFSEITLQAEKFKIKPKSFVKLIDILNNGKFKDLKNLEKIIVDIFDEFEKIYREHGFDLYYDNVDPNKPMKDFFKFWV